MKQLNFIDLKAQRKYLGDKLEQGILNCIRSGQYVMGAQVAELEQQLAQFSGAKHALGVSNGTDAITLVLASWNIQKNDAVFVPSFTFASTAECPALLGATPVFIDCDAQTYNICPEHLEKSIQYTIEQNKYTPKAIITVDLFGQPADYDTILAIADKYNLKVLCDSAQAYGARYKQSITGSLGHATTTSFFPAKPLGAYGDGGAIFTNCDTTVEILKSLRVHGQGSNRYEHINIGYNNRLDTLQAEILLHKLAIYPEEIIKRNTIAQKYTKALQSHVITPYIQDNTQSVWAQYTILLPESISHQRQTIQDNLSKRGIPTAIYYPKPLHQQPAYKQFAHASTGSLPVCEKIKNQVLALPMHPYLNTEDQQYIIDNLIAEIQALF